MRRLCRDPDVNSQEMKYFEKKENEARRTCATIVDNEALMRRHCGETETAAQPRIYPPVTMVVVVWRWCAPNLSDAGGRFVKAPSQEPGEREARLREVQRRYYEEDFHEIQTSEWKQKEMMKLHNVVEAREAPTSMREGTLDQELIESGDVEKYRDSELTVDGGTKEYEITAEKVRGPETRRMRSMEGEQLGHHDRVGTMPRV